MKTLVDIYVQSLDVIGDAIINANKNVRETNINVLKQGEGFFKESIAKTYEKGLDDYQHILNKMKEISFPAEIKDEHFKLINAYGNWVQSIAQTTSSVYDKSVDQYFKALEQQSASEQETLRASIELRKKMAQLFKPLLEKKNSEE